jgi:hypothetical protein
LLLPLFVETLKHNRRTNLNFPHLKCEYYVRTSIVNHLHQQPRVTWSMLTTKVNVKNTFTSHIDKKIFLTFLLTSLSLCIFTIWKFIAYYRLCRMREKIIVNTKIGTALTTILPILFQYCYKYCYSDSRNLWAVMKARVLTFPLEDCSEFGNFVITLICWNFET